ncbi:MAG: thioredoxin peroxidase [Deltaproteobacteria bacterium RBG_13_65_10]|nr:MAG: thioredoxin peroxidase [Deltaproteobacteria bacterium RBG_13_65_10]
MIKVGQPAPDFTTQAYVNGQFKTVSLKDKDFRGKWVVLFFYPLDFTFVCPTEILGFSDHLAEFQGMGAEVITCSTDSVHSHRAWANTPRAKSGVEGVKIPMLEDTSHRITRDYGVLIEEQGIALRGTFIIDPEGVLQYMVVHALNVGRSVSETLRVLQALQSGGLCPIDWNPGQKHLVAG